MSNEYSISVVIPTLNEEQYIALALKSLRSQTLDPLEVICVDGGSHDGTVNVARTFGSIVFEHKRAGELVSRNFGAQMARGSIVLFTSSDVIAPPETIEKIAMRFRNNHDLIALTGLPVPVEAPMLCKLEYGVWNTMKHMFDLLPGKLRRFISSSSFLAVRKSVFQRIGGFKVTDWNADGLLGRQLQKIGPTLFCREIPYLISARRYNKLGLLGFNRQFFYCIENFFPMIAKLTFLNGLRANAMKSHQATGQKSSSPKRNMSP